jgi:hypothetical protein
MTNHFKNLLFILCFLLFIPAAQAFTSLQVGGETTVTGLENNTNEYFNLSRFSTNLFRSDTMTWSVRDDGSNVDISFPDVGGNNYVGISTTGGFMQLYANPNPANDYLLFTITETQGADTEINFYEGGTTHNRLWSSGSVRIGGNADNLCTDLTDMVDCDTPGTGADLVLQDDLWLGGSVLLGGGLVNITNRGLYDISGFVNTSKYGLNNGSIFDDLYGSSGISGGGDISNDTQSLFQYHKANFTNVSAQDWINIGTGDQHVNISGEGHLSISGRGSAEIQDYVNTSIVNSDEYQLDNGTTFDELYGRFPIIDAPYTKVFDDTAPTTYTQIALSPYIGSKMAIVGLAFNSSAGDMNAIAVRSGDDTREYYHTTDETGAQLGHHSQEFNLVLITPTDVLGNVVWKVETAQDAWVTLAWYITI